ncbi:hypothetical protein GQ457_14G018970 [Hibiscus cannabinus]
MCPPRLYILQNQLADSPSSGSSDGTAGYMKGLQSGGIHRTGNSSGVKEDYLLPKALEYALLFQFTYEVQFSSWISYVLIDIFQFLFFYLQQAITALEKGTPLLKNGRRGKPKFCPFRLSSVRTNAFGDAYVNSTDILSQYFERYPQPEKEYQSFSLIYNDRSLDLASIPFYSFLESCTLFMGSNSLLHQISKDKDEAKVWFTGLKALISHGHNWKGRLESRSDGISSEATSPKEHTPSCSPELSIC